MSATNSIGPLYPGTAASRSGPETAWANPNNAKTVNASTADSFWAGGGDESNPLDLTNFGFNIPSIAVIDGVHVELLRSGTAAQDSEVKLIKAGSPVGTNKAAYAYPGSLGWQSYGGAEDLWGTTLTPAEVNASNFGVTFSARNTSGGGGASIDAARITVLWHYDISVDPADVPKRYLYKVFDILGRYLGNLPNVTSEFNYALDINSAGTSIVVDCSQTIDVAAESGDRIMTEDGDYITTEDGNYITTEGQVPIVGLGGSVDASLIQNGNRVEVWEYGYYYPNGKLMFSGQINTVEAVFGDSADDKIRLKILSDGTDLDNIMARGAPFEYTEDQVQDFQNHVLSLYSVMGEFVRYGQTWEVGVGEDNVGRISLVLDGIADVTVAVYNSPTDTVNPIASITKSVNTNGAPAEVEFGFATLASVVAGGTYFFTVSVKNNQSIWIYLSTLNSYADGAMYTATFAGGSGGGSYNENTGYDLWFKTSSGLLTTTADFNSKDPTTEMLEPIIDDYNLRGGLITHDDSIDATGLSLSYTFNTQTILEVIKAVLSLSPSGFYFYVDPSTNILHFKEMAETAEFLLVKGRNIKNINLVMSIENVKNFKLFSGGDTGSGENLYAQYQDNASIAAYGVRLERKSDNRVTIQGTADAIGESFIDDNKDEQFQTIVTITDSMIDTTLFKPGKVVGLRGFGSFVDSLLLQIARVEYFPHQVVLTLGNLPIRQSDALEQVTRSLIAEQTVANPEAPS